MTAEHVLELLRADFPRAARLLPLARLAALAGGSAEAIELAIEIAADASVIEPSPVTTVPFPPEIGALAQWRLELGQGFRRAYDVDALTRAAICEANARDELRDGLRNAARQSRLDAARFIAEAVASRQVRAA